MVAAARGASRAALVVVLLAVVVVTAACGAADPAGGPSPRGTSGPCGSTGAPDETTDVLLGMTETEATARVEAGGLSVRVVGRGSECFPVTMDFRADRVNLDLDDAGTVRGAGRG
ncbi:MAG: hypothetical protein PGN11_00110 [Quadrisphaera sp.]